MRSLTWRSLFAWITIRGFLQTFDARYQTRRPRESLWRKMSGHRAEKHPNKCTLSLPICGRGNKLKIEQRVYYAARHKSFVKYAPFAYAFHPNAYKGLFFLPTDLANVFFNISQQDDTRQPILTKTKSTDRTSFHSADFLLVSGTS